MALSEILILIGVSMIPFLELRAGIPYGMLATSISWPAVFLISVLANIALGPLLYYFLDNVVHLFLRIRSINVAYHRVIEKTQRKIHPYVEKYGWWGVALFIGVPLPGTGVYSAALGSYVIGLDYKQFFLATVLGVLIAGILVTLAILTGTEALSFL